MLVNASNFMLMFINVDLTSIGPIASFHTHTHTHTHLLTLLNISFFRQIRYGVFITYLKSCGVSTSVLTFLFYIIYVVAEIVTNIWLSEWSDDEPEPDGTQDIAMRNLRLGVFGVLGAGQGNIVA